jgi:hypothetical protein
MDRQGSGGEAIRLRDDKAHAEHARGVLPRRRITLTEGSFAHVCDTGEAKRTWLLGLARVAKLRQMMLASRNLSTIMRAVVGIVGTRSPQGLRALMQAARPHFDQLMLALDRLVETLVDDNRLTRPRRPMVTQSEARKTTWATPAGVASAASDQAIKGNGSGACSTGFRPERAFS